MTMRLKLYTLLCISFLLIFTACNQDDDPVSYTNSISLYNGG